MHLRYTRRIARVEKRYNIWPAYIETTITRPNQPHHYIYSYIYASLGFSRGRRTSLWIQLTNQSYALGKRGNTIRVCIHEIHAVVHRAQCATIRRVCDGWPILGAHSAAVWCWRWGRWAQKAVYSYIEPTLCLAYIGCVCVCVIPFIRDGTDSQYVFICVVLIVGHAGGGGVVAVRADWAEFARGSSCAMDRTR